MGSDAVGRRRKPPLTETPSYLWRNFSLPRAYPLCKMTDFNALYRKYAPDVFRFALYLSGSRADAEDITS